MPKPSSTVASYFDARVRSRSIAKLYGDLDDQHRRELVDRFSQLPRQIHSLAMQGLIPSDAGEAASMTIEEPEVSREVSPEDFPEDSEATIDAMSWTSRLAL